MKKILSRMFGSLFEMAGGKTIVMKTGVAAVASLVTVGSANAIIVGGAVTGGTSGGTFLELSGAFISPEPNGSGAITVVGEDNFDLPNLYAFNEDQNIDLMADLAVDLGAGNVISNGETVASHYVFFDPLNSKTMIGYVDFDAAIIGVATSTINLNNSDFLLNDVVTYLGPNLRGLEGGDTVSIGNDGNGDPNRLYINWGARSPGDFVRVFTQFSPGAPPPAVPVPAALPLFGTGLVLMGYLGWRKKRRAS